MYAVHGVSGREAQALNQLVNQESDPSHAATGRFCFRLAKRKFNAHTVVARILPPSGVEADSHGVRLFGR